MAKVFIGVGHGGGDPGAIANDQRESDVNLVMALAAARELARHGVQVGLSRETDEYDPLTQEIQEANAFAPDFAFECHNNSGGGDGFEVYRQTGKYAAQSKRLAELMEARVKEIGQNSRGVKTKLTSSGVDYFGWLRQLNCPAVLNEGAFLDNKTDVQIINTVEKKQAFGVAYAKAALDYLGIAWKDEDAKKLTPGYSVQEGFYTKLENAQRALEEARKEGRVVILTETKRYL